MNARYVALAVLFLLLVGYSVYRAVVGLLLAMWGLS